MIIFECPISIQTKQDDLAALQLELADEIKR